MKKLHITAKFEYKKEEFNIKMWVSGRLKDDLIKRAEVIRKEGDEVVNMLDKIKEDRDRIYAEQGTTIWRPGTKKFKKEIQRWKRDFPDNEKVKAQIKKLEKIGRENNKKKKEITMKNEEKVWHRQIDKWEKEIKEKRLNKKK